MSGPYNPTGHDGRGCSRSNRGFTASILGPDHQYRSERLIDRPRLLRTINSPLLARTTIISAPFAFGKTTLALQWASTCGLSVEYVSIRPVPGGVPLDPAPTNTLGALVAQLLTTIVDWQDEHADENGLQERLLPILDAINDQPFAPDGAIIIDDLDVLRNDTERLLGILVRDNQLRLPVGHVVLISRRLTGIAMEAFHPFGLVRVITQEAMRLDTHELNIAVRDGLFPGTDEEAHRLRDETNGWLGGMLIRANEDRNASEAGKPTAFDMAVINEIVMPLPILVQRILSTDVPVMSDALWQRLERLTGEELPPLNVVVSQLPIVQVPPTRTEPLRFAIPPAVRATLSRFVGAWSGSPLARDILKTALGWHVESGEIEHAVTLARRSDMWSEYLKLVAPHCTTRAMDDERDVLSLTGNVPPEELARHPDIAYLTVRALYLGGRMRAARTIAELLQLKAVERADQLMHARLKILHAGHMLVSGSPERAIELAAEALDVLPPNHQAEQLHASIIGERAARHLGDVRQIADWTNKTNEAYPTSPSGQNWWHRSVGRQRAEGLAIKGRLHSATRMLSLRAGELEVTNSSMASHYLLSLANIDMERGNLESARRHLQKARLHGIPEGEQFFHDLADARLLLAEGNPIEAERSLQRVPPDPGRRTDQIFRLTTLRAQIAMETGDIDLAEAVLDGAPTLSDTWPQNFGDINMRNVRAGIAWSRRDYAGALAWLDDAIAEGNRRDQPGFLVRPYVLKAAILADTGDHAGATDALERALAIANPGGFERSLWVHGRHIRDIVAGSKTKTPTASRVVSEETPTQVTLTGREIELLRMAAEGKSNSQIADESYISLSTVKNHFTRIFAKLGVNKRQKAVERARQLGLL